MKTKIFKAALLAVTVTMLLSFDTPTGWKKAGTSPDNYEMVIVRKGGQDGKNAATIESISPTANDFGTLMQSFNSGKYKGKQIKMTGYLKSADVSGWAGFWLRVDGQVEGDILSFDNMYDRPIIGTTEWKKFEILLPVPNDASRIAFGALIAGSGQIWFDNITFEVVDNADNPKSDDSNKSDTDNKKKTMSDGPVNLDFED